MDMLCGGTIMEKSTQPKRIALNLKSNLAKPYPAKAHIATFITVAISDIFTVLNNRGK